MMSSPSPQGIAQPSAHGEEVPVEQMMAAEVRLAVVGLLAVVVGAIVFVVWMFIPTNSFDSLWLTVSGVLVGMGIGVGVAVRAALRATTELAVRMVSLMPMLVGGLVIVGMLVGGWWTLH
jgi:hypothetical protein